MCDVLWEVFWWVKERSEIVGETTNDLLVIKVRSTYIVMNVERFSLVECFWMQQDLLDMLRVSFF